MRFVLILCPSKYPLIDLRELLLSFIGSRKVRLRVNMENVRKQGEEEKPEGWPGQEDRSFSPPGAGSGPGLWEVTAQGPEGPWTGISGRTAPWPKRGQRLLGAPCGGWRRSWGGDGAVLFHGLPATERSLQALATHPLQTEGSLL